QCHHHKHVSAGGGQVVDAGAVGQASGQACECVWRCGAVDQQSLTCVSPAGAPGYTADDSPPGRRRHPDLCSTTSTHYGRNNRTFLYDCPPSVLTHVCGDGEEPPPHPGRSPHLRTRPCNRRGLLHHNR
ncbi:hypothetical protein Hamer_G031905, partial [Homarus americanus]